MPAYYIDEDDAPSQPMRVYLEIDEGVAWLKVYDGEDDWYIAGITPQGRLCRAGGVASPGIEVDKDGKIVLDNKTDIS